MSNLIYFDNSTLVTGATSTGSFLTSEINEKLVGIPVYNFIYTNPPVDFMSPAIDLDLNDAVLTNQASSYGVGMALTINTSSFAVPLYKLWQNDEIFPNIKFYTPTIVANLSTTGNFLIVKLNDNQYGIPLYNYSTEYPFTTSVPQSSINVNTKVITETIMDVSKNSGSTYLNPRIKAYSDLINRIKRIYGYPMINFEICDENMCEHIDQALELFSKYSNYTEEFLIFHSSIYQYGCGMRMDRIMSMTPEMYKTCYTSGSASFDYDLLDTRKVANCFSVEPGQTTGINTLFSVETFLSQSLYWGSLLGTGTGYNLVDWHCLQDFLKTREKVLAQKPYFRFDPKTQILKIIPEPFENNGYFGAIGCWVEARLKDMLIEPWVQRYVQGLAGRTLAHIRGKYSMSLFSGGSLNYNDLMAQSTKLIEECENQLITGTGFSDSEPPRFFMG